MVLTDSAIELITERQNAFLEGFSRFGTVTKASEAAGVSQAIPYMWNRDDKFGFTERWKEARQKFRDRLEQIALDRVEDPQGNRGSDILLMGMLNANWPEKWNRNLQVTHEVPSEVLKSLQALQKQAEEIKAELPAPEGKVVEGQARKVLPWED